MIKTRDEINEKDKWDLSTIYKNNEEFDKDQKLVEEKIEKLKDFKDTFTKSGKELYSYFKFLYEIDEVIGKLYTYVARKKDEDLSNNKNMQKFESIRNLYSKFSENNSFYAPELLKLSEEEINSFFSDEPKLTEYKRDIDLIIREKSHILTEKEEKILSMFSKQLDASDNIFSILTDSDMTFDNIIDENNNSIEFNESLYSKYIESPNRDVRKNAYDSLYKSYKQYINTITKTLATNTEVNAIDAKLRGYSNSLEASLYPNEIDTNIYKNLIETINNNQEPIYEYFRLKKELLGLDTLNFYDVYTPVIKETNNKYSFDEAKNIVLDALKVLGEDYIENLNKAFDERWIDIYNNKGKCGGAYSSGTYKTNPFVLLNFEGKLNDVSTLAHELGHSMHTYYSKMNQPIQTSTYTLFCAEVASTVNELILSKYMIKNSKSKEEKLSILNRLLELFKSTIYRQTMFSEFELWMYEEVENNNPLTSETLSNKYKELLTNYFSDTVEIDDNIIYEWARIPHFYYNFYVYQYATGLSAACQIVKNIEEDPIKGVENYKKFLSSGGSMDPVSELKLAGVDISKKEPIESAIEFFKETLNEFKEIYYENNKENIKMIKR